MMSKAAKGKGKTRGKNGKTENVLRSRTKNRQTAFQNNDSRRLLMFL